MSLDPSDQTNLTPQEIQSLGLESKVEIVWDATLQRFTTKEGAPVNVIPLGNPALVVSHYDQGYSRGRGSSYTTLGTPTHSSTGLSGTQQPEATHYAVGGHVFAHEIDWDRKLVCKGIQFYREIQESGG